MKKYIIGVVCLQQAFDDILLTFRKKQKRSVKPFPLSLLRQELTRSEVELIPFFVCKRDL